MNDGSKQFSAWFLAIGLSGTIFGGGTYWLKKHAPSSHDINDSAETSGHSEEHAAAPHGEEHAAAPAAHGEEHAAAPVAHGDAHAAAPAAHGDAHAAAPHAEEHAAAPATHGEEHAAAPVAHGEEHAAAPAAHAPHWSYAKRDSNGPSNWGSLAPNFYQCEKGMEQSPIDISGGAFSAKAPKIVWHYDKAKLDVENNGHTIQASDASKENFVTIDGEKYTLAQFHFHNPSEHRVKGIPGDLEMHFVHKNAAGKLAVIGVMINEGSGKENLAFKPVWDLLPHAKSTKAPRQAAAMLTSLLPANREFFHYKGSLTTPPCSEGVRWFVLQQPINISAGQVEMYTSIFEGSTNRPVQPMQGRDIITNKQPAMAH
jgi:carbonic anhydrase